MANLSRFRGCPLQLLETRDSDEASPGGLVSPRESIMDMTTLLIILLIVVVLGGGFYGRRRWF